MATIHLPALPQSLLRKNRQASCAYNHKSRRFPLLLDSDRHKTITYSRSSQHSLIPGAEHRTIAKANVLLRSHGYPVTTEATLAHWEADGPLWTEWNALCVEEIKKEIKPGDLIGLIGGNCQRAVAEAFPGNISLEPGVGYTGVFTNFCAFESNSWRSAVRGPTQGIKFYDRVIPNSYDVSEFMSPSLSDGYLLYMGRLVSSKGAAIISDLSKHIDMPIYVAGQGAELAAFGPKVQYLGLLSGNSKKQILRKATAVLVPSLYNEPFGGVNVEAQMAGVPVITTDWACFNETVIQDVTGRRCNTLQNFVDAVDWSQSLTLKDREGIAASARSRYSIEAVKRLYQEWLDDVESLAQGRGWQDLTSRTT